MFSICLIRSIWIILLPPISTNIETFLHSILISTTPNYLHTSLKPFFSDCPALLRDVRVSCLKPQLRSSKYVQLLASVMLAIETNTSLRDVALSWNGTAKALFKFHKMLQLFNGTWLLTNNLPLAWSFSMIKS